MKLSGEELTGKAPTASSSASIPSSKNGKKREGGDKHQVKGKISDLRIRGWSLESAGNQTKKERRKRGDENHKTWIKNIYIYMVR